MKLNFQYLVEVEYNTERDCLSEGCYEEGICRCERILNTRITSLNYSSILDKVLKNCKIKEDKLYEINVYGVERICKIHELFLPELYYAQVARGYYGEEIEGVYFEKEKFFKDLEEFLIIKDISKKTEFLLKLEYGEIPKNLLNKKWSIVNALPSKIDFNKSKILNSGDYYKDYKGVKALCLEINNKYKLIDGHHRMFDNSNKKIRILKGVDKKETI